MEELFPHQIFRDECSKTLLDARRQEAINPENVGEFAIVEEFFKYLQDNVMSLMLNNDWVFAAVSRFVREYRHDCFDSWESTGIAAVHASKELDHYNELVGDFLKREAVQYHAVDMRELGDRLRKGSDFLEHVNLKRLPGKLRGRAKSLHKKVSDFERRYIKTISEILREDYESVLPRIMFVFRRVVKIERNLPDKPAYDSLLDISGSLEWYESNIDDSHSLFPALGFLRDFYKIVRNAASHVESMQWESETDSVHLPDKTNPQTVDVYEYIKKYRYLVYILEMGMATILAAYCEHEKDELAVELAEDYIAMIERIDPQHPTYGEDAEEIHVKQYNDGS